MKINPKKLITEHKTEFIISSACIIVIVISVFFILNNIVERRSVSTVSEIINNEEFEKEEDSIPHHQYNLNNIRDEDGWKQYYDDSGSLVSCYGIDLSYYQKEIDWQALKAEGISFVILRIGYRGYESGNLFMDKKFDEYFQNAKEAGIDIGIYFFSQSVSVEEAVEEAEFVVENLKNYDNITYPVAYDWEPVLKNTARTSPHGYAQLTDSCIEFCKIIESAGYTPIVYTNRSQAMDLYDLNRLTEYDIWLAEYSDSPKFPYNFTIWQYTSEGRVDGIEGKVDLNICFKDYTQKSPA